MDLSSAPSRPENTGFRATLRRNRDGFLHFHHLCAGSAFDKKPYEAYALQILALSMHVEVLDA